MGRWSGPGGKSSGWRGAGGFGSGAAAGALLDFQRGAGDEAGGAEEEEEEAPAGGAHQGRQQGEADGDVEEDDEALEELVGGSQVERHDGRGFGGVGGSLPAGSGGAAGSAWASSGTAKGASVGGDLLQQLAQRRRCARPP